MQTNEKISRDINVLLSLDTYQGMTDEEIDLIIAYKTCDGIHKKMIETVDLTCAQKTEQIIADNKASCEKTEAMLQSLLSRKPELKAV